MNLPRPRKLKKPIVEGFFSKEQIIRYLESHGYKKYNELVYKDNKDTAYISVYKTGDFILGKPVKKYMVGFVFKEQVPIM